MKMKNIVLVTSFLAYLFLFYQQSAGVNMLIFSIIIIASLVIIDSKYAKNKSWVIVALGTLMSGFGVALYGNDLSQIANLIALAALAGLSFSPNSSLVFAFLQAVLSYLLKPFHVFFAVISTFPEKRESDESKKGGRLSRNNVLKISFPIIILLAFITIYSNSNPLFSLYLHNLGKLISWGFISFSIFGIYVIHNFFYPFGYTKLIAFDATSGNNLLAKNPLENTIFGTIHNEHSAAKLTFVLLNVLLFVVNLIDICFIIKPNNEIVDYSQYIHQGVNASIFSVLMAILVVLYFFRGNLNFLIENRNLKILALVWLVLNIVLLLTCFHKNFSYINVYGLTPKRIGVYAYLLVTFIGLLLTWIKIVKQKSNIYLVRSNFCSLFILLSLSTTIHWNQKIFDYNIKYHPELSGMYYYNLLPESSLVHLSKTWEKSQFDCAIELSNCQFQDKISARKKDFIHAFESKSWQSFTLKDYKIYRGLK